MFSSLTMCGDNEPSVPGLVSRQELEEVEEEEEEEIPLCLIFAPFPPNKVHIGLP